MPALIPLMCETVTFDYQLRSSAIKVGHIITKLMLSSEFESEQLTIAQQIPKESFSRCLVLSQLTSQLHEPQKLITTSVLTLLVHVQDDREKNHGSAPNFVPHPNPLPRGEGERPSPQPSPRGRGRASKTSLL